MSGDSLAQSLVDAAANADKRVTARTILHVLKWRDQAQKEAHIRRERAKFVLAEMLDTLAAVIDYRNAELNAHELRTYAREIREGR